MYQQFTWRGKPISNIEVWAKERGERMVKYEGKRFDPWLNDYEYEYGEMPESFWNGLAWAHGWSYKEL